MTVDNEIAKELHRFRRLYPVVTMDALLDLLKSAIRAYQNNEDEELHFALVSIIALCHLWLEDKSLTRGTRADAWGNKPYRKRSQ